MKNKLKRSIKNALFYVPLFFLISSLSAIIVFKYVSVPYTPLMAIRSLEHRKDTNYRILKEWKPLSEIAPEMTLAVMASEDIWFFKHKGFDWESIRKARRAYQAGESLRGASTISQQTAKNVFLLPYRSWVRKGLEIWFTVGIEWLWGKERIMEVYLNVVELGQGVFGVEAAAQHYFQKPAKELTIPQAALIATCLPAPRQRNPLYPTQDMERRAAHIERLISLLSQPEGSAQTEPEQIVPPMSGEQDAVSTSSWVVYGDNGYDYVKINLSDTVSYRSFQEINPNKIVVDIYGVTNRTTWIHQFPTKAISNVYYLSTVDGAMLVVIDINGKQHWGHSV